MKLVARVMNAQTNLLGWAEVPAVPDPEARGLRVGPFAVVMTREGQATEVWWHWCDPDVCWRVPLEPRVVLAGAVLPLAGGVVLRFADEPRCRPLPAVTVAAARIDVPVGQMGARG